MIIDTCSEGVKEKKFFKGVVGKIAFIFLVREITVGKCINLLPSKSIHFEDASVRSNGKVLFDPVFQVIN